MDISEAEISTMLKRNVYHAKPRHGPHAGKYYRVIRDVYDDANKRIKNFFQCSKCSAILKCNPSNGTKPLNQHANICDPPESECLLT